MDNVLFGDAELICDECKQNIFNAYLEENNKELLKEALENGIKQLTLILEKVNKL